VAQVVRPYRGVSADERRAQRRERLMEAGLDVLGAEGLAKTTMTAICARAGLTERYFYESFRSRDELLAAVFEADVSAMSADVLAAVGAAPPDLYLRCRAAAGTLIAYLTDDPRRARAYVEGMASEAVKDLRAEAVRAFAAVLAEQIRELRDLRGQRYRAQVELATIVLIGGVSEAVTEWLEGRIDLTREQVIDECARLCVAAADAIGAGS
jgi:AcrR family transcriptional regulator